MKNRLAEFLFCVAIFFLPWQTILILEHATIGEAQSQYGVFGIYIIEFFILATFILRGRPQIDARFRDVVKALCLFLAFTFVSLSMSKLDFVGWSHAPHLASSVLLFFMVIDKRTELKKIAGFFVLGLMVPCVFAWFQVLTGRVIDSTIFGMAQKLAQEAGVAVVETAQGGRTLRAYGTFPHPNIFGGYLVIGLAIVTWLAVSARSKFCVFLCAASCCVLSATLMITFSRSAWIACVLWFAVLFFVTLLARCALSRKLLFVAFAALTAFVLIAIFFRAQVFSRFDTSLRVESLSVEERTSQYDEFGKVFLSSPILGTGPGAYTFALALQKPGMPVWEYQPIHNTPLLILAELGIVGLLFFVHWVYRIDKLAHSNWREHGHEFALALGSVLLVIALFDHYLWSLWPGLALSALSLAIMMKISYND